MNLYEVLGVEKTATKDELQSAYRRAAMKAHPDREGGSTEAFQAVEQAGRILLDDDSRREYDETGAMPGEMTVEMRVKNMATQIMVGMLKKGLGFSDCLVEMKKLLQFELRKNKSSLGNLNARLAKTWKAEIPARRKEGSQLLEELKEQAIAAIDAEVRRVQADIDFMEAVMEHFDHYEIDTEERLHPSMDRRDAYFQLDMMKAGFKNMFGKSN